MKLQQSNHFNFFRLLAAIFVLFAHSFVIAKGNGIREPLISFGDNRIGMGTIAVFIFFAMSGFLIAGSWDRRPRVSTYLRARILRIFPGLAVVLIVSIIVGAMITVDRDGYVFSAFTYFFRNLLLYRGQPELSGVFSYNSYGPVVNGSLWTLRHEFTCYLIIAALGYFGWFKRSVIWAGWLVTALILVLDVPLLHFFKELLPLMIWFLSGVLVYLYRDVSLNRNATVFIGFLTIILLWIKVDLFILSPLLSWLLIKSIYSRMDVLSKFAQSSDVSYGMYIYAFPVQQFLNYWVAEHIWWQNFLLALPITFCLAWMSWHLIEKPALQLK